MKYTPEEILRVGIPEESVSNVATLTAPALIRRVTVTGFGRNDGALSMYAAQIALPLVIPTNQAMKFGSETITAIDYFRQVIENGDMIDAVASPVRDGMAPVSLYWIHIQYVGTPSQTGSFRKKDDGLFAMWTKGGEKAERVVARKLRGDFGHSFTSTMFDSPGFFEIRYVDKKVRKPDRTCLSCGLTFEVKKRNKDRHFRVSHSNARPFASENRPDGWHAFVFADMSVRFIPNADIAQSIADGKHKPDRNQYDDWTDVDHLIPSDPPYCSGA